MTMIVHREGSARQGRMKKIAERVGRTREAGAAAGSGVIGVLWRTLDAGNLHDCGMRNGRSISGTAVCLSISRCVCEAH
jgi:hypothetical protein